MKSLHPSKKSLDMSRWQGLQAPSPAVSSKGEEWQKRDRNASGFLHSFCQNSPEEKINWLWKAKFKHTGPSTQINKQWSTFPFTCKMKDKHQMFRHPLPPPLVCWLLLGGGGEIETGGTVLRHRHQVDRGWSCSRKRLRSQRGVLGRLEGHLVQNRQSAKRRGAQTDGRV